jgi:hypothetical protein
MQVDSVASIIILSFKTDNGNSIIPETSVGSGTNKPPLYRFKKG